MNDRPARFKSLKHALEDIAAAGEEARLQLNLLTAEARSRKEDLEENLEKLESTLDRGIEQVMGAAADGSKILSRTLQGLLGRRVNGDAKSAIESLMNTSVRTCSRGDFLQRAAQLMWDHDVGSVLVLDERDALCGIVTDRDVCMAAYTTGLPLWNLRVADVMTKTAHTCRPGQTLAEAAAVMAEHQVRRLPVIDGHGHPIGVLGISDIVRHAPVIGLELAQRLTFQLLSAICRPREGRARPSAAAE